MVIQVNGKTRDVITVKKDVNEKEIFELVVKNSKAKKHIIDKGTIRGFKGFVESGPEILEEEADILIPAAMARSLSNNPIQMVILSILGGILSVLIGLFASLEFNTASGPSIIVVALILFILSLIPNGRNSALQK